MLFSLLFMHISIVQMVPYNDRCPWCPEDFEYCHGTQSCFSFKIEEGCLHSEMNCRFLQQCQGEMRSGPGPMELDNM